MTSVQLAQILEKINLPNKVEGYMPPPHPVI